MIVDHWEALFETGFLKWFDVESFTDGLVLYISAIKKEEVTMVGGVKDVRPVISFRDHKKKLVLCKQNAENLKNVFGEKPSQWIGREVRLVSKAHRVIAFGVENSPAKERENRDASRKQSELFESLCRRARECSSKDELNEILQERNTAKNEGLITEAQSKNVRSVMEQRFQEINASNQTTKQEEE